MKKELPAAIDGKPHVGSSTFKQRPIKFRAWDDGRMVYPTGAFSDIRRFFRVIREDAPIMQYTGYDDYNDKPIYEGDIIRSINGQIEKAVIEYHNASFWVRHFDNLWEEEFVSEMWWDKRNQNKAETLHWPANRIALEVIGNVFQNPDLLG